MCQPAVVQFGIASVSTAPLCVAATPSDCYIRDKNALLGYPSQEWPFGVVYVLVWMRLSRSLDDEVRGLVGFHWTQLATSPVARWQNFNDKPPDTNVYTLLSRHLTVLAPH